MLLAYYLRQFTQGQDCWDLKNWRKEGNGNLQKKDSIIEYAFYVIEPKIKPVCRNSYLVEEEKADILPFY